MTRLNVLQIQTRQQQQRLVAELQAQGLTIASSDSGVFSRRGGAGPSDHKAVTIGGTMGGSGRYS